MEAEALRERLAYLAGRLANAERIGKPGHIARCRERYDGMAAILAHVDRPQATMTADAKITPIVSSRRR